ncbi:MAG TPA: transposase [Kiritimatiellia bacterium]|nr:transposase [Kiritimatiellia bacterium]
MTTTIQQSKTRRQFDDAFKRDAVNHVIRTHKSCAEVARELGIRGNLLARWKREQLEEADQVADSGSMKPSELVAALEAARREAQDLREQRDILKKALNIFSQPMESTSD